VSKARSEGLRVGWVRPISLWPFPSQAVAEAAARVKTILDDASVDALHVGLASMAALLAAGGIISAVGIRDPRPDVRQR